MSHLSLLLIILAVQTTPLPSPAIAPTAVSTPHATPTAPALTSTPTPKQTGKAAFALLDPKGIQGLTADHYAFDFGTVHPGQTLHHEFHITNTGKSPVKITEIKADCGCTTGDFQDRVIAPGETATFTVTYTPEYQKGTVNKRITVFSDLAHDPNWIEFNITATITSVLDIDPLNLYFKKVHFGEPATADIHIHAKPDSGVTVKSVSLIDGRLDMKLLPVDGNGEPLAVTPAPGDPAGVHDWILRLTLPGDTPVGKFVARIRIETSSPDQPEMIAQAIGFVRSPVSIYPTQCYLGALTPGKEVVKTYRVGTEGDATLEPPTVRTDLPGLTWSVETVEEGKRYSLEIRIAVPADHQGRLTGDFTILTNDPTRPEFTVPVFGYTPSGRSAKSAE